MKVAELSGALLDYWVAQIEGLTKVQVWAAAVPGKPDGCFIWENGYPQSFWPSSDWAQGGPIIERERIGIEQACPGEVYAYMPGAELYGQRGDTPLIAAMRCYVASKFGDEVPDDEGERG